MRKTRLLALGFFLLLIAAYGCAEQAAIKPASTTTMPVPGSDVVETEVRQQEEQQANAQETAIAEQATQPKAPAIKEFTIEGDDYGLYPEKISVAKGDNVRITFKARRERTYSAGLEFRGLGWGTTGTVQRGESRTVEFTADKGFTFSSYWPSTNRLKATGQVEVG